MIIFWLLVIVIMVICAWIIFRIATHSSGQGAEDSEKLKVAIFRENIQELESELKTGDLDSGQLENVRTELELSLLEEVNLKTGTSQVHSVSPIDISQKPLLILTSLVVCFAVLLYAYLGNPQVIKMSDLTGNAVYSENPDDYQPSTELVVLMEQHLGKNPEDVNGLYFLASNYIGLSDYENAAITFEKLYQIAGDNPQVLVSYIDVLVRLNDGSFAGRATELIERAVMVAPDNYSALLFAGLASEEAGDYRKANGYYKRLVPVLEGNPQLLNTINMLITNTDMMMQQTGASSTETLTMQPDVSPASVKLAVSIADEFKNNISPEDVLFIYAQAIDGSPMPLAVFRTEASALPLEVTLDDSLSMMPTHKLSNFNEAKVQARISKSGSAEVSSGDLVGVIENVQTSETEILSLIIDTVIP